MRFLLAIAGLLLAPRASAQGGLVDERFTNENVTSMIDQICAVLPFCDVGPGAFLMFATKVATFVLSTISVLAVTILLYAAIKIIMSQGNEEGVSDAKKIALYALGGLVLAITGQAIVMYFINVVVPQSVS